MNLKNKIILHSCVVVAGCSARNFMKLPLCLLLHNNKCTHVNFQLQSQRLRRKSIHLILHLGYVFKVQKNRVIMHCIELKSHDDHFVYLTYMHVNFKRFRHKNDEGTRVAPVDSVDCYY